MTRTKTFDIWRKKFDPDVVYVPPRQYRDFIPVVNVIPRAVYDKHVIALDSALRQVFSAAFKTVNEIVLAVPPHDVPITVHQLVLQADAIVSGSEHFLRVFSGRKLQKQIPVKPRLRSECAKINSVIRERLFLFEDMPGISSSSAVTRWAEATEVSRRSAKHAFRKGAKVGVLLQLLQASLGKRVVIFVRNIPVALALHDLLNGNGVNATYLHGEVDESERQSRLKQFRDKRGSTKVLVATRQLFGRGFDLIDADEAIFYSPKQSIHAMWQEMLRIRSTVRHLKSVYVLFYAWTAEHTKLIRFLREALRTGAHQVGDTFRWKYFVEDEPEEVEDEDPEFYEEFEKAGSEEEPAADSKTESTEDGFDDAKRDEATAPAIEISVESATKEFVKKLLDYISRVRKESEDSISAYLRQVADQIGFKDVWPTELVESLICSLGATLATIRAGKEVTSEAIRKELRKLFHPDRHPDAVGKAKEFWHELSVNL